MGGLSTANLSKKTYDALAGGELGPYSVTYEYGLFVHVPDTEEDDEPCPRDLSRVLKYCRKNGVDWIKFDSDETPDAKLPLYQWSDDCFTIEEAVEHHGWSIDCDLIPDSRKWKLWFVLPGRASLTVRNLSSSRLTQRNFRVCLRISAWRTVTRAIA